MGTKEQSPFTVYSRNYVGANNHAYSGPLYKVWSYFKPLHIALDTLGDLIPNILETLSKELFFCIV